jgi:hypothetical protein
MKRLDFMPLGDGSRPRSIAYHQASVCQIPQCPFERSGIMSSHAQDSLEYVGTEDNLS